MRIIAKQSLSLLALSLIVAMVPIGPSAVASDSVTFHGGGWGHAIGMSQYGALGQALDGRTYDEIATHYYRDSTLSTLEAVNPSSVLLEYPEPLWIGIAQNLTEIDFIPRGGDLEICHRGSGCPKWVIPQEDEVWTFKVIGPGECVFEANGMVQGTSGECWAGVTFTTAERIEFPSLGKTYGHGAMRLRPFGESQTAAKFHVSMSMELEDYILGIAELPPDWVEEHALKTQAVASRSYAAAMAHMRETSPRSGNGVDPGFSVKYRNKCWCHLLGTPADQVYQGWQRTLHSEWASAVSETAHEVLAHPFADSISGGVVEAYFGSSTSGLTETNVGGFGSTIQYPYLQSEDDHWAVEPEVSNPFATWSKQVSTTGLIAALAAATSKPWGITFQSLTSVTHLAGPPESWIRVTGISGGVKTSVDVPGYWLDWTFNLRSPQITGVTTSLPEPTSGSIWHQGVGTIESPLEAGDRFGELAASGDFNGDGYDDLVVSAPTDGINATPTGGLVNVIFGSPAGLSDFGNDMIHQDEAGMNEVAEVADMLGMSLATGDFNGDGYDDLAIGVPYEDIGPKVDAGRVHVFDGTASGLSHIASSPIDQDSPGVGGAPESGDRFGAALAVGDFNADGFDDLLVGIAGEALGTKSESGMATIIYGSATGLDTKSSNGIHQNSPGVGGAAEAGDKFGAKVAVGDFDGDGFDDAVIAAPGEALGSKVGAGMVHLLFGSGSGLFGTGSKVLHQNSPGIPGVAERGDQFGGAVAAGDVTGDGIDDIAIASPGEAIGPKANAGMIVVVTGSAGRSFTSASGASQNSSGVSGVAEAGDMFGFSVLIADVTGGLHKDLLVGVPGEDIGAIANSGLVHVIPGSGSGIDLTSEFSRSQLGMPEPGANEAGDEFGTSLAGGDFDGDGSVELVVGAPGKDVNGVEDAGQVYVASAI